MTDPTAFKVGQNVATTPGKVVFQNDLMQLIQYKPSTDTVFKRPLLIMPPWINKYYILDLREKNSFIKWAVDAGPHGVRHLLGQPGRALRRRRASRTTCSRARSRRIDAIEQATGEKEVNIIGYCLGGTLTRRDARLHGGEEGPPRAERDLLRVAARFLHPRANWACSSTRRRWPASRSA